MKQTVLFICVALCLSACGVKPGDVEGKGSHPRTYPDIHMDPLPHGGPAATKIR